MKTLYLDCSMGAAGDMLAAALLELLPEPRQFIDEFNRLGIPGVSVSLDRAVKCGVTGSHFRVTVDGTEEDEHLHDHDHHHDHDHDHHHGHHHSGLHGVEHIVRDHLALDRAVADDVMAVYRLLAGAEGKVHGAPMEEVHFHEVGTMDAIADITAVCMLMRRLSPGKVAASPVNVGGGTVRCAHGIMPVPAPATAELLRDVPFYGGTVQSELCTPTGAALLKYYVNEFGPMPLLRGSAVGYGMGKKDFEQANCLRAFLGEGEGESEKLVELSCDLDDMTGEELGFAMERFFDAGALDVYTVPVGMKKNRPGVLLRVLCFEPAKNGLIREIFRHTSTLGVREASLRRHVQDRKAIELDTPYGTVRCKKSSGHETAREKLEFEDLARIAREKGLSLAEVRQLIGGERGN